MGKPRENEHNPIPDDEGLRPHGRHNRRAITPPAAPSEKKSAPAEKAIHIPLPFDAVMSAVVKIKPELKETAKAKKSKR